METRTGHQTKVWGQPLGGEFLKPWSSAAFIATVTGNVAHYRGPYGLTCVAFPIQQVYRRDGVREAIRQARLAGTAFFLPVWVQVLMGMQDELRGIASRVKEWFR